ncbi:MAG: hypothetical protein AB1449_06085 [Chloroflexota bacterium]
MPAGIDSPGRLDRRPRPYLPALYAAILIVGLLGTIHLLFVTRDGARPSEGCRFGGQSVPAAADWGGQAPAAEEAAGAAIEDLAPLTTENSWRFGFGLASWTQPAIWAEALGAGWYLDWTAEPRPDGAPLDHWLMVRVAPRCTRPSPQEAAGLARRYPGRTWIIGNEPDVIWQDNLPPERYAALYHAYYHAIKAADPEARVAVAGVAQPTPLRLAYLDRVLNAYRRAHGQPMPVDVWTVHNFVLREERGSWGAEIPPGFGGVEAGQLYRVSDHARPDLFERQLREFRSWMAQRGYRNTPLALTEFGILMPPDYGFPPEIVSGYLEQTLDLLMQLTDPTSGYPPDGNRLVQRWAWFSLSASSFSTGNLADMAGGRLTGLGLAYRRKVEQWGGLR